MFAVLQPLRIRGFARLAATYTLNELADWLATIALSVLVFDRTGDALATTGLFIAAKFLPGFFVAPLTARLDGRPAARLLGALYLFEAAMLLVLAVASTAFLLPAVLGLAIVNGTAAATGRATTRAATVALLEDEGRLRDGNAVLNLGFSAMNAVGPALGGLLVALTGSGAVLAMAAGIVLAMAALAGTARGLRDAGAEPAPWNAKLREGLAYVRGNPRVRALLGGQAIVLLLLTFVTPIEVVYAKETLGAGDTGFGLLLTAWGGGMVAGSWLFARERSRPLLVLAGLATLAMSIGYLGMAAAPSLAVACAASAVGGLGNGVQWVAVITGLQEATDDRFQRRVAGLLEAVLTVAPGAGFLIGGTLTAMVSPRLAFAAAGGGVLVLLLLVGALLLRERSRSSRAEAVGLRPAADSA